MATKPRSSRRIVSKWGSPEELERKRRIDVSAWAYAYEFEDSPLVSDALYDSEIVKIDPSISTGNQKMDKFFKENFVNYSGVWIRSHPELVKLKRIVDLKREKG